MGIVQAKIIGGYGNAMLMYACARKYAELTGSRFECPDWIGRRIFGLNDPFPSRVLPDRNDGNNGDPTNAVKLGEIDIRLGGYFQTQNWIAMLSRAELRRWFTILPQWLDVVPKLDKPHVAAHIRAGDYINNPQFCNVSRESYLKCVRERELTDELVWIDQANPLRTRETQDARLYDLPDFIRLMRADVILRANSTFSWWAAVLSNARVLSPVVNDLVGPHDVEFVEGNHPRFGDAGRLGIQITDLYLPE